MSFSPKNLKIFSHNQKALSASSKSKFKFSFISNNNYINFSAEQNISFSTLSDALKNLPYNLNDGLNYSNPFINKNDSQKTLKTSIHNNCINLKNFRLSNEKKPKKKQFQCKYCLNYYARKDCLKFHIFQIHSGYKGIPCKYCKLKFKRIKDHERLCKFKSIKKTEIEFNDSIMDKKFNENNPSLNEISLENKFNIKGNICLKENNKIKKSFIKNIDHFKYFTNNIIGSGGNMIVYYGKDNKTNNNVAIKLKKDKKKNSSTYNEFIVLNYLKEVNYIPKLLYYKMDSKIDILVETLCGPSIEEIFQKKGDIFKIKIISIIGINMFNTLKEMHNKGILHNDIKPSNICWENLKIQN